MADTMVKNKTGQSASLKIQTLAALCAVIGAVALPQIVHVIGAVSGLGTALGEVILPMHLPIILVGLLAGSFAGAVSGFLAPVISFALTGMPGIGLLPFMMVELCAYGFLAGLLRKASIPTFFKVLLTQVGGRLIRAAAILIAFYAFGYSKISVSIIWTSITAGLFGIILQCTLIPLAVFRIENAKSKEP